jgi:hypothetical protein
LNLDARARRVVWILTILALVYSAVHFAESGVRLPLVLQNLGKFDEQTPALRRHLATGEPVRFENPVQYGPVFLMVVHPLIVTATSDRVFSNAVYAIQLICVAVAFAMTWTTLRPLIPPKNHALLAAWLAVLWLNFSPLYTIIAVKSVETWELALLTVALFMYARGRLVWMGIALAAASLVKVLPLIFVFYLLVTNRRAFLYTAAAMLVLLTVSHALYGPDLGLRYFPNVARSATGDSFGLLWHENLSLKAAIAKTMGRLDAPDTTIGRRGATLRVTAGQLRTATLVGDIAVLAGVVLLVWSWMRSKARTRETMLWEWSLTTVAMLILSPNTTFEYATLALGAISYALVRAIEPETAGRSDRRAWAYLGAALFFLGALLPRQLLNRVTFAEAISHWNGYTHLSASEAYQFYCFPLLGLFLLVAALWRLQPRIPSVRLGGPERAALRTV